LHDAVFWNMTPCGSNKKNRRFRGIYCLHLRGKNVGNFFAASVGCYLQLALFLVHRFLSP
jgi:hypothetical protein